MHNKLIILLIGRLFFFSVIVNAQVLEDNPCLLRWIDYFVGFSYRDYTTYKVPVDITKNGCKAGKLVTFPQKIEAVACKIGNWKDPKELLKSKDFLVMYKHPNYYWEESMAYLANPNYPEENKKIAIYAMELLRLDQYLAYLDRAYQLYTTGKLSASLLSTVIYFDFLHYHPIVMYKDERIHSKKIATCLEQITATPNLPKELAITIKKVLSKEALSAFEEGNDTYSYYLYNYPFKFSKIISDAYQEFLDYLDYKIGCEIDSSYSLSDFLVVLDHPGYYAAMGPEGNEDSANFFIITTKFSEAKRRLAIFVMHQLDGLGYVDLLREVHRRYRISISAPMIEDLFCCLYPTGDRGLKYPFFILDYKDPTVQHALNELIKIPTLPCGLKEMARKVKNGTLATKAEMAYMEGYRKFRKTHFTLYETIPTRRK